jgi:hypothetical protein
MQPFIFGDLDLTASKRILLCIFNAILSLVFLVAISMLGEAINPSEGFMSGLGPIEAAIYMAYFDYSILFPILFFGMDYMKQKDLDKYLRFTLIGLSMILIFVIELIIALPYN